jgi:hypothetical protein
MKHRRRGASSAGRVKEFISEMQMLVIV